MAISSGCFCGGETGDDRTNETKHTIAPYLHYLYDSSTGIIYSKQH